MTSSAEFRDDLFRVYDNVDTTKKVSFEISDVPTSSTVQLTIPNVSGTISIEHGGITANRPNPARSYQYYFDTTLGKPIWYNGANWVDATGTIV